MDGFLGKKRHCTSNSAVAVVTFTPCGLGPYTAQQRRAGMHIAGIAFHILLLLYFMYDVINRHTQLLFMSPLGDIYAFASWQNRHFGGVFRP